MPPASAVSTAAITIEQLRLVEQANRAFASIPMALGVLVVLGGALAAVWWGFKRGTKRTEAEAVAASSRLLELMETTVEQLKEQADVWREQAATWKSQAETLAAELDAERKKRAGKDAENAAAMAEQTRMLEDAQKDREDHAATQQSLIDEMSTKMDAMAGKMADMEADIVDLTGLVKTQGCTKLNCGERIPPEVPAPRRGRTRRTDKAVTAVNGDSTGRES